MAPFGSRTLTTRPPASCCANRVRQPSAKQRQTADGRPAISPRLKEQKRIVISLNFLCGCDAANLPSMCTPRRPGASIVWGEHWDHVRHHQFPTLQEVSQYWPAALICQTGYIISPELQRGASVRSSGTLG